MNSAGGGKGEQDSKEMQYPIPGSAWYRLIDSYLCELYNLVYREIFISIDGNAVLISQVVPGARNMTRNK